MGMDTIQLLKTLSTSSTIMTRVHDKECEKSYPCGHNCCAICDCTCTPTIQHDPENKECRYGELDGFQGAVIPCTCSRQWEDIAFTADKMFIDGEMVKEYNKPYKSHYCCWEQETSPCGIKGKHRCCQCTAPVPSGEKQEGVFYPEQNDCCEKCHDVYLEKTYPAHTPYHACVNQKCECHQEKQDWEASFRDNFCDEKDRDWKTDGPTGIVLVNHNDVLDFIRKEKELSKEEGRMAQAQASYQAGVNYAMEFHVNGECEKRIKEARLEVIEKIEEWVKDRERPCLCSPLELESCAIETVWRVEKTAYLNFLSSLKTNSK